jgi:hypothetical protein
MTCVDLCVCVDIYGFISYMLVASMRPAAPNRKAKIKIVPSKWYDARAAAKLLKTTQDTVKKHCRKGTLVCRQIGFKKQWHVKGSSISKLRKKLNLHLDGD